VLSKTNRRLAPEFVNQSLDETSFAELFRHPISQEKPDDEQHHANSDEQKEQEFSNGRCRPGNPGKPEDRCDDRDDKKY
jgi:hypothetical protein